MESEHRLEHIGILSSGIAHDFNNLLVTILGNTDLALRKLPPEDPSRRYLISIRNASLRASDLAGQLLAYSGAGTIAKTPVDLHHVLEEMVALLEVIIPPNITLSIRYGEPSPVLLVNETQLRRIIMNLITNAVDAIGNDSGAITITTGISEVESENETKLSNNGNLEIGYMEVTDDGPGISPEAAEHIFEPFFTTKPSGRGIGLAVVREHVSENDGTITCGASHEGGARFTVSFPCTDSPVVDQQIESIPDVFAEPLSGNILVIDDEAEVLETTASMLDDAGFSVHSVSSGAEGLRYFSHENNKIGLVIIDLTMPGKDGFALARQIRNINGTVPVVIASGYSITELSNKPSDIMIDAYIQKPYQIQNLISTIARCIKRF